MINDIECFHVPRKYVRFWFKLNNIMAKDATSDPSLFSSLSLDYHEHLLGHRRQTLQKTPAFKDSELKNAFEEYIKNTIKVERAGIMESYRCDKEDLSQLEMWVRAITGDVDPKIVAIFAHWMWMVKRRGFSLDTMYEIMPIIYGEQNGGKSRAITALLKPLSAFQLNMGMNQISDERLFEALSQNLLVFFDEMQGVERTDMSALKNQITTKRNSYRKLYSHAMASVPMTCSFIGATNKHLNEMLFDSTGMRRFYEINALAKLDWKLVNSLDYVAMWKNIDEKREEGYLVGDVLAAVLKEQVSLVNEEDIEVYIREREITKLGPLKDVSATALFKDYERWYTEAGIKKPLSRTSFVRKLQNRGVVWEKRKETIVFSVSAGASMFGVEDGKVLSMPV